MKAFPLRWDFIFTFLQGSLNPKNNAFFKKKSKEIKAFPLRWDFIFTFLQGSRNPKNYELAPQVSENNYQCSPAPWK